MLFYKRRLTKFTKLRRRRGEEEGWREGDDLLSSHTDNFICFAFYFQYIPGSGNGAQLINTRRRPTSANVNRVWNRVVATGFMKSSNTSKQRHKSTENIQKI